jgi:hypothetical protein
MGAIGVIIAEKEDFMHDVGLHLLPQMAPTDQEIVESNIYPKNVKIIMK